MPRQPGGAGERRARCNPPSLSPIDMTNEEAPSFTPPEPESRPAAGPSGLFPRFFIFLEGKIVPHEKYDPGGQVSQAIRGRSPVQITWAHLFIAPLDGTGPAGAHTRGSAVRRRCF